MNNMSIITFLQFFSILINYKLLNLKKKKIKIKKY